MDLSYVSRVTGRCIEVKTSLLSSGGMGAHARGDSALRGVPRWLETSGLDTVMARPDPVQSLAVCVSLGPFWGHGQLPTATFLVRVQGEGMRLAASVG